MLFHAIGSRPGESHKGPDLKEEGKGQRPEEAEMKDAKEIRTLSLSVARWSAACPSYCAYGTVFNHFVLFFSVGLRPQRVRK